MSDGSIIIDTKIDGSQINKQIQDLGKNIKNQMGTMRDFFQGVMPAVNILSSGIKGLSKAFIGNASAMEDMTAAFTPLVGGSSNAEKMIKALNKEAATTPFELGQIGAVAKQLLPILGNDVKKVTDTFRMLGDTAGGNAQKLESITRGYSKAMMKGKVDMESLNMISDQGVPIQSQLEQSTEAPSISM
jgi:tape measure domain-containing protein